MSNVINGLINATTGITITSLWGDLLLLLPVILITFIFAFGYNKAKAWLYGREIKAFMSEGGKHISHEDYHKLDGMWEEL